MSWYLIVQGHKAIVSQLMKTTYESFVHNIEFTNRDNQLESLQGSILTVTSVGKKIQKVTFMKGFGTSSVNETCSQQRGSEVFCPEGKHMIWSNTNLYQQGKSTHWPEQNSRRCYMHGNSKVTLFYKRITWAKTDLRLPEVILHGSMSNGVSPWSEAAIRPGQSILLNKHAMLCYDLLC